jgi:hypothetical protein
MKLCFTEKQQMALSWRSKEPLLLIGVHSELDEAAAVVLATLTDIHGIKARPERLDVLRGQVGKIARPKVRRFRGPLTPQERPGDTAVKISKVTVATRTAPKT